MEADIRSALTDPDSAQFLWAGVTGTTNFKPAGLKTAIPGKVGLVCGMVNSHNRMGGYAGYAWFWVAIKDGVAILHLIDESNGFPMAKLNCQRWGFPLKGGLEP
ncbi:MAG: hypothetical protein M3T55_12900 [Pseudomonadota bacterium]|nr:hypothetical protein [Pseudomonadota bacterium]